MGPDFVDNQGPLLADSVEKVGHPKLTAHWTVKMSFLRAAT
jgi:hypothetical protein